MARIRRIKNYRWWNNRKLWIIFLCFAFLCCIRFSKSLIYRDIYYLVTKPFWPGKFQREILINSLDKELNIKVDQLQKDNNRLRKLLSLQRVSDLNTINASVISRNTGSWWKKLMLNKGLDDGVEIGNAVIGPGGLLGYIEDVSNFTSSVRLLTSVESKMGVWTQRTNIHGLLIGVGNNTPKLVFYEKDLDIKEGDFVFTSPASTLLPPNIPVGIIESVDKKSVPKIVANIQLIADPHAIDWVQVLKTQF